jgi:nicotinamide mononucleotide (NMN) deamidase PncC
MVDKISETVLSVLFVGGVISFSTSAKDEHGSVAPNNLSSCQKIIK